MDDPAALEQASIADQRSPRLRGVPLREVWRWIAPGVISIVLAFVFFFGLWSASRATDRGTEAVGFATAALALIGLAWTLKAHFDGGLPAPLVTDAASMVVLAGLLTALAIGGLVLAARGEGVTLPSAGYGMFLVSIGAIYYNLRHYFDCRDRTPEAPDKQERTEQHPGEPKA